MATIGPTAAVGLTTETAANAATTSESSSSQTGDLAIGIIVVIALAAFVAFVAIGVACLCVRRRRTKRRQAALLATAKANAENIQLSQQNAYPPPQYSSQDNSVYYPDQTNGFVAEMPAASLKSPVEADGQPRFPPRASELYTPPAGSEMFAGGPTSSELDGTYGHLPLRPDSDVTSPMLRKDYEQAYSDSWRGGRSGS